MLERLLICFKRKQEIHPPDAYLVVHRGVRWTDVVRLTESQRASIGRASDSVIVVRSTAASRHHAVVRPIANQWAIEDLGSRNGVTVNGKRIGEPQVLNEGDRIGVAGFEIRFVTRLNALSSSPADQPAIANQPTEDAIEFDPEVDVLANVLASRPTGGLLASLTDNAGADLDRWLLRLAFTLGRADSIHDATETFMNSLQELLVEASIGMYWFGNDPPTALPPPIRINQTDSRRYRRPPETLTRQILESAAPAILARNVLGDRTLATENTHGEIDVESILLVPLQRDDGLPCGLVHATAGTGDRPLNDNDLQTIVAAGEIFTEAIRAIGKRQGLQNSLRRSRQTIDHLRTQLAGRVRLLGRSTAIAMISDQIAKVAPTNAGVLIRGESGSGKELIAAAIHHASPRRDGPMVCLNCAAISRDLLESELFGHEKGAFTGATDQKRGKFETASGGTLMLDEIGEMSLDLQAKLLRVLEGHPFERVGGQTPIRVDVRIVAATHRDLAAMVAAGNFRQDLFYRLHIFEIVVPPLRERGNDVILLADHFLRQFAESMGRGPLALSPDARKTLLSHHWPGNVRELRNAIERAVVMSPVSASPQSIGVDDLRLSPVQRLVSSAQTATEQTLSLAELERRHIDTVLQSTGGNKSRAAIILGIERSTLDRKLKRTDTNQ